MTDIVELQNLNEENCLVFRQAKVYMPTDEVVFDVRYERGIQVRGMMNFFGKKGEFRWPNL
jgi:hypothetical protein